MRHMDARRRAPKPTRGGQSGFGNPRNDGRITEEQHDEAVRILRAEYYQGVRSIAEDLARAVKDGEIKSQDDFETWIHQTVDGSYWVIYTHANHQVLFVSDNHDAYTENYGEAPVTDSDINWAALAYAAMEADVRQVAEEPDWENLEEARRPRHRVHPHARRRR